MHACVGFAKHFSLSGNCVDTAVGIITQLQTRQGEDEPTQGLVLPLMLSLPYLLC